MDSCTSVPPLSVAQMTMERKTKIYLQQLVLPRQCWAGIGWYLYLTYTTETICIDTCLKLVFNVSFLKLK